MPAKRERSVLVEAARLYYLQGRDQGAVARRLGVSRSSVSRILAAAREEGIVHITIVGDSHIERNRELEAALLRKFGLREVLVASATTAVDGARGVAALASQIFLRRGPSASRIGLSWGLTIGAFTDALPETTLRETTRITALVGGMPSLDSGPSGNLHIQQLAEKCGISAQRFDAPAIVESSATYDAMMSESYIRQTLQQAASCELAFVGVGTYGVHTSRQVLAAMKLNENEMAQVEAQHPVGDILGRFFDIDGTPLGLPTSHRVIGITIEELKAIDCTVALASSRDKASGVLGALRTGAIDVLVVDEALAAGVLSLVQPHAG